MAPEHAYGKDGLLDIHGAVLVPPDASVVFEVELLDWIVRDDLFKNGKAIKCIVQEGTNWQKPRADDEVRVSYSATSFENGELLAKFDNSEYAIGSGAARPFSLALTLERALSLMKCGE